MELVLTAQISDDVAADIQKGSNVPLSRRLLELAAIRAYEAGLITEWGVIDMLGFADREELFDFFRENKVCDTSYTIEELEKGQVTLSALLDKP